MVDRLATAQPAGVPPIFQVMFILQKDQRGEQGGLAPFALREAGPRVSLSGVPSSRGPWRAARSSST